MGELDSAEGKGALKKEREVHQKLLADSHGLVMDLRWQIHHREKNWNREKVELLERLDSERQEWGRQKEELLWRVEQVGVPQQAGGSGPGSRGERDLEKGACCCNLLSVGGIQREREKC